MPFVEPFLRYADFSGRSTRFEYWTFYPVHLAIVTVLWIMVFTTSWWLLILLGIYQLATIIPRWSLGVRRLHDTGRSGWWLLLLFVPFFGFFILLFFNLTGSDGNNEYGPEPR